MGGWIGRGDGVDGGGWGVCSIDSSIRRECTTVDRGVCWRLVLSQYLPDRPPPPPQGGGDASSSTSTSTNDDDRSAASDAHALPSLGECDGIVKSPFVARPPMPGGMLLEARVIGLPEEEKAEEEGERVDEDGDGTDEGAEMVCGAFATAFAARVAPKLRWLMNALDDWSTRFR